MLECYEGDKKLASAGALMNAPRVEKLQHNSTNQHENLHGEAPNRALALIVKSARTGHASQRGNAPFPLLPGKFPARLVIQAGAKREMERCLTTNEGRPFLTAGRHAGGCPQARVETAQWFAELRLPVYRYLVSIGLPSGDAEEVVQETFLRLYCHLAQRGSPANLRAWIFEVARNAARDLRKSARWRRTVPLSPRAIFADSQAGPEARAVHQQRCRRLEAAISGLTGQERECILLRISGLRYREIAEVLDISVSSAGELVRRAADRLTEDLA